MLYFSAKLSQNCEVFFIFSSNFLLVSLQEHVKYTFLVTSSEYKYLQYLDAVKGDKIEKNNL